MSARSRSHLSPREERDMLMLAVAPPTPLIYSILECGQVWQGEGLDRVAICSDESC